MSAKTLLSLVPACLLLCACASGGAKTEVSPLVGKYQAGETVAIFNPDGTFEGTTTQNETWVRGNYTLNGNEVTLDDTWESDGLLKQMGKSCMGTKGRYRWALEGDVLVATVIDDACEGRRKGTDGVRWTRMP